MESMRFLGWASKLLKATLMSPLTDFRMLRMSVRISISKDSTVLLTMS